MKLGTYHCHTTFCDGKNTAEEMVLSAIERGMPELGFSAHSSIATANYTLKSERVKDYIATVNALKEKYRDSIRIYLGIEADVVSNVDLSPYDYVIGSVHYVIPGGHRFDVDYSAESTRMIVKDFYSGDPYAYAEAYYSEVETIYERTHPDIIGHFDLLTKFIEKDPILDLSHPRYIAARDRALEKLLSTPAVFEVNTGAISRGYRTTPYPEDRVLLAIRDSGKKVVLNSDSHAASTIDCEFEATRRHLDDLGVGYYKTLEELLKDTRG